MLSLTLFSLIRFKGAICALAVVGGLAFALPAHGESLRWHFNKNSQPVEELSIYADLVLASVTDDAAHVSEGDKAPVPASGNCLSRNSENECENQSGALDVPGPRADSDTAARMRTDNFPEASNPRTGTTVTGHGEVTVR